jgi:hypothetical protein
MRECYSAWGAAERRLGGAGGFDGEQDALAAK